MQEIKVPKRNNSITWNQVVQIINLVGPLMVILSSYFMIQTRLALLEQRMDQNFNTLTAQYAALIVSLQKQDVSDRSQELRLGVIETRLSINPKREADVN